MPTREQDMAPTPFYKLPPPPQFGQEQPTGHRTSTDSRASNTDVHLLDFVRILYKRRWTAATVFVIAFLSIAVHTFTATPLYEATAKMLIEAEGPNILTFQEVIDERHVTTDYYQTQYDLLRSRSLARTTLERLGLWSHPEFGGESAESGFGLRAIAGATISYIMSSVAQIFGLATVHGSPSATPDGVPGEPGETDEMMRQSATVDAFLGRLQIVPVRNSRIVDVRFSSAEPAIAADVVNTLSHAYIEQNLEFRFSSSQEASDWLTQRLTEQRSEVEESEAALQEYREDNDAISLEDRQDIVVQKLADLNAAVTRAKTSRIEREARYRQLAAIQNDLAALDTFPGILSNTFIQQQKAHLADLERQHAQLSESLGERHPDMLRIRSAIQTAEARLQGEIAKVVESVHNEFLATQAQEWSLTAELEAQKSEALSMNRKGIEYGVLEREAESNRQIYESLLQRSKETGVAGELRTSNARLVDEAEVPRSPSSPRVRLNMLLALVLGSSLAIGLTFFFEYLDNRIKSPEEIEAYLGLPFLGFVPMVAERDTRESALLLNNGVPANFAESLRTVRTNLMFSSAAGGTRTVVVTSTGPGEGKSVVASNLGISLAQAGQRVLLIDADLRNPQVHERFAQKPEPGVSNLTVDDAKASEVIRKTTVPGLWILPAGRIPPNPAELLGSKRFHHFLTSLDKHFDWVIIDTPPVMPVADAAIVAHEVGDVVFVVGSEMTNRRAADAALDQLTRANARFAGAVLNRVDIVRHSYYYSQYYRREYAKYYQRA